MNAKWRKFVLVGFCSFFQSSQECQEWTVNWYLISIVAGLHRIIVYCVTAVPTVVFGPWLQGTTMKNVMRGLKRWICLWNPETLRKSSGTLHSWSRRQTNRHGFRIVEVMEPQLVTHITCWCFWSCGLAHAQGITHSFTHILILTITCTCCYDEIKGTPDLKIYSHADAQIDSLNSSHDLWSSWCRVDPGFVAY